MQIRKVGSRPYIILSIIASIATFYILGGKEYLSFQFVKLNLNNFQSYYQQSPWPLISVFTLFYIFITSLSIPGGLVLTLLAGAIFGIVNGTVIVNFACTVGASISFLISRYMLKNYLINKFRKTFNLVEANMRRDGILYLFTIRLMPASPAVLVNLLMGLTSMKLWTFTWVTFLGMLPGSIIFVYMGRKLSTIDSLKGLWSPSIIMLLLLLGLIPYMSKKMIKTFKKVFKAHQLRN